MSVPFARLVVDTACSPGGLGTRGAAADGRVIVYRHGGVEVEVMLQGAGAGGTIVWGQVTRAPTGRPCADAAVTFLDGGSLPVSHADTDRWGEFRLAVRRPHDGALRVRAGDERFDCWVAPPAEATR